LSQVSFASICLLPQRKVQLRKQRTVSMPAESQSSPASTIPSPQDGGLHGVMEFQGLQGAFGASEFAVPLSHVSLPSSNPLPHSQAQLVPQRGERDGSHCSPPLGVPVALTLLRFVSTTPSPQTGKVQLGRHALGLKEPVTLTLLKSPSSHCSPASRIVSPHLDHRQLLRQSLWP